MKIVKNRFPDVKEEQIESCVGKYGNKPRFILEALEDELRSTP